MSETVVVEERDTHDHERSHPRLMVASTRSWPIMNVGCPFRATSCSTRGEWRALTVENGIVAA